MRQVISELRLNSKDTIAFFDRVANTINVYLKTKNGSPARKLVNKSGWDIIKCLANQSDMTVSYICKNYDVHINRNNITFNWH